MRVIAGTAKGTRLGPVPRGVRPLSDRAREGLFSSLAHAVDGAAVLDLYAGTGAVGIEALSRGAGSAAFVERDPGVVRAIRANLQRTRLDERATVVGSDVLRFLRRNDKSGAPFNLCLLDPPYRAGISELQAVLEGLAGGWLSPGGFTVVLTRGIRSSMPVIPVNWRVARRLEYGDSLMALYREV